MRNRDNLEHVLAAALAKRYPPEAGYEAIRELSLVLCQKYIADGLGDRNAVQRLCSAHDAIFWQQFSEVLVADQLSKAGLHPSHNGPGPDFLVEHAGGRIWIEVICPKPEGIPVEWLRQSPGVGSFPHEAMLLRWTAAIKEKSEKLLGKSTQPGTGYLAKGLVAPNDAYVIAINGRLLRGAFTALSGISQWPFAVEATFCVGPYSLAIDRETRAIKSAGHQHRTEIPKANGSQVPADTFLDPRFKPVSAIWALDIDESLLFGRTGPMEVVHNPLAINALPRDLLPAQFEHVAFATGDHYVLEKHEATSSRT